jgi:hypothetical protein
MTPESEGPPRQDAGQSHPCSAGQEPVLDNRYAQLYITLCMLHDFRLQKAGAGNKAALRKQKNHD